MDEYISREAVINIAAETGAWETQNRVRELPVADVQSVVRCKDCKYREEHHYEDDGESPYIKYGCKFTKYSMSDEGFCSFGAKKGSDSDDEP